MDVNRNAAKHWMKYEASLTELEAALREANLTPIQEEILILITKDTSVVAMCSRLHTSETTIKRQTKRALGKLSRVLSRHS